MAVPYHLIPRKDHTRPGEPVKNYASLKNTGEVSLRELSDFISGRSTVTSTDILATLEALLYALPFYMGQGKIVRLGEFGSFRITLRSEGVAPKKKFNPENIREVKVVFHPGPVLKKSVKRFKFVRADKGKQA